MVSKEIDEQLLRIERASLDTQRRYDDNTETFCLLSVWNAQPESADAKYAKKRLLASLNPEPSRAIECQVEGCNTVIYPKNPDYKTDTDTEFNGGVYNEPQNYCRFADFCLKECFRAGKGIKDKRLRKEVQLGAYVYYTAECKQVAGANLIGGNYCVRPGCNLSAGFSEDGCGGTVGQCIDEQA